ncbi:MAG: hypothetical protein LC790_03015 [Actinobacteria bacterium]|nr:hypothetical protein [Actinomycetota bacterium]
MRELKEQAAIPESFTLARLAGELTDYGGFDGRATLLLLDEAGMAATCETAVVLAHAERADKLRTPSSSPTHRPPTPGSTARVVPRVPLST